MISSLPVSLSAHGWQDMGSLSVQLCSSFRPRMVLLFLKELRLSKDLSENILVFSEIIFFFWIASHNLFTI
jgi:hypothetical protein